MGNNKERSSQYLLRGLLSIGIVLVYGLLNYFLNNVGTIAAGGIAGKQFESSDSAYLISQIGIRVFSNFGIQFYVLLGLLILIWWKPVRNIFTPVVIAALCIASAQSPAHAYYDQKDYAEPAFILPNESAFYIPDVGDNKTSQAAFGSIKYLEQNKIPTKRFVIPHTKLENSGLFSNYYVPAGRLIVVDRTPFNREWVSSSTRGSSTRNEGFPVQSKEGINITLGIAIAASVTEDDSPKFLYKYGVKAPAGNRNDPNVIFTSVYYGKSLTEVMDGVVRSKVQALLGNEFTKRPFIQCNSEAEGIMMNVEKNLREYLAVSGITLDYIGFADTFEFDKNVQDSINRQFIATQDKQIAQSLAPHTDTITALSVADAMRSFGNKTDGKLPTSFSLSWLPSGFNDAISNFFKKKDKDTQDVKK